MKKLSLSLLATAFILASCNTPANGPDITAGGAVLGGAWGAGAGAIVGKQLHHTGPGTAIGAGFGVVSGALTGAGLDIMESDIKAQEQELASLKAQNEANADSLRKMEIALDRAITTAPGFGVFQVFFDIDVTNLQAGSIANLEVIADSIRGNPRAAVVMVVGHADDSGNPEYNQQLSEARALEVAGYLMRRGISQDQIKSKGMGSSNPIASNANPAGRQLNRRVDVYIAKN